MTAVTFIDGPLRGRDLQLYPDLHGWTYRHVEPPGWQAALDGGIGPQAPTYRYTLAEAFVSANTPKRVFGYLDAAAREDNLNAVLAERWRFQCGLAP